MFIVDLSKLAPYNSIMKTHIIPDPIPLSLLNGSTFETLRMNFISIVNEQLRQRNLNKSWLAHRLKVSAPVVTKLLSGKSNPTLKTIAEISDILKIDMRLILMPKDSTITEKEKVGKHSGMNNITNINIEVK